MPNWCMNTLSVTGPVASLAAFQEAAKGKGDNEGLELSFQSLLPTPAELLEDMGGMGKAPAWYEWRVENWGTKWDLNKADGPCWDGEPEDEFLSIFFQTAWAPPVALIQKVATDFPDLTFRLEFAEDGMDFSGTLEIKGDFVLEETEGTYADSEFYCESIEEE